MPQMVTITKRGVVKAVVDENVSELTATWPTGSCPISSHINLTLLSWHIAHYFWELELEAGKSR